MERSIALIFFLIIMSTWAAAFAMAASIYTKPVNNECVTDMECASDYGFEITEVEGE